MKDVKRFVFLAMILMLTQFGAGPQLFSGETPVVKAPDITSGAAADLKANDESDKIVEDIKLFARALSVIDEAYVENVQMREMLYAAVKGMMESLGDRYSEFIDPERYKLLQIHLKGEYAGIGVILEMFGDIPGIKAVNPDSAAARAGLEALDKILKIDGSATSGVPIADIAAKLRGEADTPVMMTIQRDRIQKIFDVKVIRQKIEIESVKDARIVGKAVGYFRLNTWQDHTVEQVDKAIKDLRKKKMKALIIDLRDNDGGLLPQAVGLAERFLPKGAEIVSVDSKVSEQKKEYVSSGRYTLKKIPLVVLVNHKSASASEIFSAAMQDNKRATVVGTQTFGKASVQSVVPLDDQSAMKLTTARYRSPLGRDINHLGITPDAVVENGPPGAPNADRQIVKALEILKDYV